jgi:hypothetical protein
MVKWLKHLPEKYKALSSIPQYHIQREREREKTTT